jgi:hypothetical protein
MRGDGWVDMRSVDMQSEDYGGLASQVAAAVLIVADEAAQRTAWGMWQWCREQYTDMVRVLADSGSPRIRARIDALRSDPGSLTAYREIVAAIACELRRSPAFFDAVADRARAIRTTARMAVQVSDAEPDGPTPREPTVAQILATAGLARPGPGTTGTEATIVIPFRAKDASCGRARNLAACLAGLSDQSHPRSRYRIVVVESDDQPRWRDTFGGFTDGYVFARNSGRFNKSWAVNCGVVHGGGRDGLVCILDADLLVDSGFIARSVSRFYDDTLQAHWPHRTVLFADERSSRRAIEARCLEHRPDVSHRLLRGTCLYRPPGGCIWLRRSLFDRIAGMDERFEGWGGEDNDLGWRAELYGGLERFDDQMLHLNHRRAVHQNDDGTPFGQAIPWCTWSSDSAIGDLRKYEQGRQE